MASCTTKVAAGFIGYKRLCRPTATLEGMLLGFWKLEVWEAASRIEGPEVSFTQWNTFLLANAKSSSVWEAVIRWTHDA